MTPCRDLPPWLNFAQMTQDHPMPLMGRYIGGKLEKEGRKLLQHVNIYKCSKCGFYGIFEKK